jgi:hypothetical protein
MRYHASLSGLNVTRAMLDGKIDAITNPRAGDQIPQGVPWVADNGCYGSGWPGEPRWWLWLKYHPSLSTCLFAVAPDVVGDAAATIRRSRRSLPRIRGLGVPAAFVAQDGLEHHPVPWDDFDVLFIGGSTDWKIGPQAADIAAEAQVLGKPVHMGRVNSYKRLRYAQSIGCETVDGTFVAFGSKRRLPELLGWMTRLEREIA